MFGRQSKEKIEKLKQQVEQMRDQVPAEAAAFYLQCDEILRAAAELLSKWFFRDMDQLQDLQSRAATLFSISGGLTQLIRGGQNLAESIRRLREGVRNDPENAFIIERCDAWMAAISQLGRHVELERHLQLEERRLLELESSVRNHAKAIELLGQADKYSRELASLDTAHLRAVLPKWKEDFYKNGISTQKLTELEKELEPLERKAKEPPPPPPRPSEGTLQLRRLFEDLRNWGRVLNQRVSLALEDSYRRLTQSEAPPSEVQVLQENLSAELKRLRDSAFSNRVARLQELRQDAGYYHRFCGESPELDERLERLARNPGDTPPNYEEWITQYRSTDQFFLGIAQTKEEPLSQGLRTTAAGLEQRRQAVAAQALTRALRTRTVALGASVGELSAATGQTAIREALRTTDQLARQIAELEAQAQQELTAYEQRKSQLLTKIDELGKAAAVWARPELVEACDGLSNYTRIEDSKSNDLDEMEARLKQTEEKLNDYVHSFLSQCVSTLDQEFDFCRDAHRVIALAVEALAQGSREPRFSRDRPHSATVAEAVHDFQTWKLLSQQYLERIQTLTRELTQAIDTGREYIEQLVGKHGYLSPEQRHEALDLMRALNEASSIQPASGDAMPQFASLASLFDRYKTFLRLVEGEREELRKDYDLLKDRLRKFNEDEFKEYFPGVAERVSSMIYGIDPDYPCGEAREQIDLARVFLDLIEDQAKRLAAQELEVACAAAEISLRATDRGTNEALRSALQEVQEYAPQQLAPAPIRRRLLEHIGQNGGTTRG